jgi:hypothetical protein
VANDHGATNITLKMEKLGELDIQDLSFDLKVVTDWNVPVL